MHSAGSSFSDVLNPFVKQFTQSACKSNGFFLRAASDDLFAEFADFCSNDRVTAITYPGATCLTAETFREVHYSKNCKDKLGCETLRDSTPLKAFFSCESDSTGDRDQAPILLSEVSGYHWITGLPAASNQLQKAPCGPGTPLISGPISSITITAGAPVFTCTHSPTRKSSDIPFILCRFDFDCRFGWLFCLL